MVHALEILKKDHREVEVCYKEYKHAGPNEKETWSSKIFDLLELHAATEETVFYPELRKELPEEDKKRLDLALIGHADMKEIIANLKRNDTSVKSFDTEMRTLMKNMEHHVREEEKIILPLAEKYLGKDRLKEIGEKMEQLKERG